MVIGQTQSLAFGAKVGSPGLDVPTSPSFSTFSEFSPNITRVRCVSNHVLSPEPYDPTTSKPPHHPTIWTAKTTSRGAHTLCPSLEVHRLHGLPLPPRCRLQARPRSSVAGAGLRHGQRGAALEDHGVLGNHTSAPVFWCSVMKNEGFKYLFFCYSFFV